MHKRGIFTLVIIVVAVAVAAKFYFKPLTRTGGAPAPATIDIVTPPAPVLNITVSSPKPNAVVRTPLMIKGTARVFEGEVSWRLKDMDGTVLAVGHTTAAAADVGQFGPYSATSAFTAPKGAIGMLEVFDISAKDGSEIDRVVVPVRFK
jgi:hypothetical protein